MKKLIVNILTLFPSVLLLVFMNAIPMAWAMPEMPPAVVNVIEINSKLTQDNLESVGTLKAMQGIVVTTEVPGRVSEINFKSGQNIKKGDLVLNLNDDVLQAQLKSAKAKAQLSLAEAARIATLYKKNSVSKSAYEQAQATKASDQAGVDEINARLDQMHITAPFAGKLGLRKVSVGDYLQPGQAIVNLQSLDPILVIFAVPENYIGQVKVGQSMQLNTSTYKEDTFRGEVFAVDALLDAGTRSLSVQANIPNPDKKLMPGMFVDVTLALGAPVQAIHVPQSAVVYDPEGAYVYLVKDNKAVKRNVTLGVRTKDSVIIESGLRIGDTVISDGQQRLFDGAAVMVAPSA